MLSSFIWVWVVIGVLVLVVVLYDHHRPKGNWTGSTTEVSANEISDGNREEILQKHQFFYETHFKDGSGGTYHVVHMFPEGAPVEDERRRMIIREMMGRGCNVTEIKPTTREKLKNGH
jgi:hypothetical protein